MQKGGFTLFEEQDVQLFESLKQVEHLNEQSDYLKIFIYFSKLNLYHYQIILKNNYKKEG